MSDTDSEVDILPRLGRHRIILRDSDHSDIFDTDSDDDDFRASDQNDDNVNNDNDTDSLTGEELLIFSCESSSRNANVCQSVIGSVSHSVIQSFSQ